MNTTVIKRVANLYRNITTSHDFQRQMPKEIKNLTQMQILIYLLNNRDKVIYQKDIGEALKLKKSSITEHLDYLEEVGDIIRIQEKEDKRKNSIYISKDAMNRKFEIDEALDAFNKKLINGISDEDLQVFDKVMKKMEENIKA